MPDTLTPQELETERRLHRLEVEDPECVECHQLWPCDASRLLAHIDALTAAVEALHRPGRSDINYRAVLAILRGEQ